MDNDVWNVSEEYVETLLRSSCNRMVSTKLDEHVSVASNIAVNINGLLVAQLAAFVHYCWQNTA